MDVNSATPAQLDVATLYGLLRLRVDIFVVEQRCAYPELDGRDLEPSTVHAWTGPGSAPTACLRVLVEPDGGRRIGRVCVHPDHRSAGLAGTLMRAAVDLGNGATMVLDAQAHLTGWYARFGFEPAGPEFLEDGIPHVTMTRPQAADDGGTTRG